MGDGFSALAGHQLATLSAEQSLHDIHIILLIFAAGVFVAALLALVDASRRAVQAATESRYSGSPQLSACCSAWSPDRSHRKRYCRSRSHGASGSRSRAYLRLSLVDSSRGEGGANHSEAAQPDTWDSLSGWMPEA